MNIFVDSLKRDTNYTTTTNGAIAHKSTLDKVYDMFALGGSYRTRSNDDCILLFKNALEENEELALKCLFYLRDIRGGAGERRFFKVCFNWLAKEYPELAFRNLDNVAEYGRWDDLYCVMGTSIEEDALDVIKCQFNKDLMSLNNSENTGVSLLGKWMKSENCSSKESKELATKTRKYLGLSHKEYRKALSALRTRINIVEKLMSENRWEDIEFDKLPSKAGLIYRNAFAHKEVIAARYEAFMNNKETKVNAGTLYPYEIVKGVTSKLDIYGYEDDINITETERATLNKYWENQDDYLEGKKCKALCMVDTSGSMTSTYRTSTAPIDVAISLGMYCGERIGEPFNNCFITFSERPEFIEIEGVDFVDKVRRIYERNQCENTNLKAAFDLIKRTIIDNNIPASDRPDTLIVISDMEIDCQSNWHSEAQTRTEMENIEEEWRAEGLEMPKLIYWNVSAENDIILQDASNKKVSYVSGCSPIIFKTILSGKTGLDMMMSILGSDRYKEIR